MKRILLAVALIVVAASAEARAQGGLHPRLQLGGWGGAGASNQFYGFSVPPSNLQDRMPYFSLYPPVYYSNPVPRTYGYSPFAYPGIVPTPEFVVAQPQIMANPYVTEEALPAVREPASPNDFPPSKQQSAPKASKKPMSNKVGAVQPLRMLNPHFGEQFVGEAKP